MWTSVSPWQVVMPFASNEHDYGRGSHSSTFRLNVSTFCGIHWLHDSPPVY
jgi:hypothetical protein